jgi:glucose/mannose-6-phosphate isomerase
LERGDEIVVMANGGKLLRIAKENNIPHVKIKRSLQPRFSSPFVIGVLILLVEHLSRQNFDRLIDNLVSTTKQFLSKLYDNWNLCGNLFEVLDEIDSTTVVHICGLEDESSSIASRLQAQLNENAKILALASNFPELSHNLFAAITANELKQVLIVIKSKFSSRLRQKQIDAAVSVANEFGKKFYVLEVEANSIHEETVKLAMVADLFSVIVSEKLNADPLNIDGITKLKKRFKELLDTEKQIEVTAK